MQTISSVWKKVILLLQKWSNEGSIYVQYILLNNNRQNFDVLFSHPVDANYAWGNSSVNLINSFLFKTKNQQVFAISQVSFTSQNDLRKIPTSWYGSFVIWHLKTHLFPKWYHSAVLKLLIMLYRFKPWSLVLSPDSRDLRASPSTANNCSATSGDFSNGHLHR